MCLAAVLCGVHGKHLDKAESLSVSLYAVQHGRAYHPNRADRYRHRVALVRPQYIRPYLIALPMPLLTLLPRVTTIWRVHLRQLCGNL